MDVIDRTPSLGARAASLRQEMVDTRRRARQWTRDHGDDLPEVRDWTWTDDTAELGRDTSPSVAASTSADF